jgi:hypothetical protein
MNRHRLPVDRGDQLHFEPDYRARFLVAWVVTVVWVILLLFSFLTPEQFSVGRLAPEGMRMILEFGSLFVLGGTGAYLRGQYICLDRHQGQILQATGFSGKIFGWDKVATFALDGTFRFQYCQAELQSLCVLSYQSPGSPDWLVIHIYTQPKAAAESARRLRIWAPELTVIEEEDQAALTLARERKPLVH